MKRIRDIDIKKEYNNFKREAKKYVSNNILFLSYIVISVVISLILRLVTVGFPIYFKSFLGDLMILLIIGSFVYFFKPKYRFRYLLSWLVFFSVLAIGNTIYYRFYASYLSINLIQTASMIGEVNDAVFEKVNVFQFFYLFGVLAFIFVHNKLNKNDYYENVEKNEDHKRLFIYTLVASLAIFLLLALTITPSDTSRLQKQWNREYIVQKYGIYTYHVNDIIQSIQPHFSTLFGYDEAALRFRNYYACKWSNSSKPNKWTNKFKGKNVIFIHAESIQGFLVDLKINGEYVTPNLNNLAHEGLYFDKFYPQISVGTSSDSEFTLNTGLMPSSSGTVFVNYYNRKYYAAPEYFSNMGYYTFSAHANNADYWNRKIMHAVLGYKDFYAKDTYEVPSSTDDMDWVGLGLSDKSFFKQLTPIIKDIKDNKSPFYGTVITLSNHSPFNDLKKYDEFNLTMDYSYTDESGNKVDAVAPYLEGTAMGNYLKSAHYADAALGEFIEELRESGILENTVIILYGDHEARISKREFIRMYNYDPLTDSVKDENDPTFISMDNYNYDLLKNTPLIMWSDEEKFSKKVSYTMGMYDLLPTIANMFGFKEKYSLGNDIFSSNEKIVVFPNGNILTDKVYYSNLNDEYISLQNSPIDSEYINRIKEYANEILEVSNGIVVHDLILKEEDKIGECELEKKK